MAGCHKGFVYLGEKAKRLDDFSSAWGVGLLVEKVGEGKNGVRLPGKKQSQSSRRQIGGFEQGHGTTRHFRCFSPLSVEAAGHGTDFLPWAITESHLRLRATMLNNPHKNNTSKILKLKTSPAHSAFSHQSHFV